MYATNPTEPATITVPAPTRDNPAGGTTGTPPSASSVASTVTKGKLTVPAGVAFWAATGLAIVVGVRLTFRNGGVA